MMKELVKSGKIWTLLSAFIFMMTCGLVVYAATTNGVKFAVDYKKSEKDSLTYTEWNNLMGDMDNIVPKGAIMIFDSASGCPEGWTQWNNSNGKFIMGATSISGNRTGGSNTVQLKLENVPPHSHYYKDTVFSEKLDVVAANYHLNKAYTDKYPISNNYYLERGVTDLPGTYEGSIVGSNGGADLDNYPIYGVRMTSYDICGKDIKPTVIDLLEAQGEFKNLANFKNVVMNNCYADAYTNSKYNTPSAIGNTSFSVQNEYYTVIFCKKN